MRNRFRTVVISACALVGSVWALSGLMTAAPPDNTDELRWLPVENAEVFDTMGARVFRLHIPARQLAKHKRIVVTTKREGENPKKLLAVAIDPTHEMVKKAGGAEVTFVMYWDTPVHEKVTRIHYSLTALGATETRSSGPPLLRFNGYKRPNLLTDLTKGMELCSLVLFDNDGPAEESVVYSLWLE
jgi:hypothetical protein